MYGIVLAKIDGTAKGGVVTAIRKQVGLPVKYIGVGETGRRPSPCSTRNPFVDAMFAENCGLAQHQCFRLSQIL